MWLFIRIQSPGTARLKGVVDESSALEACPVGDIPDPCCLCYCPAYYRWIIAADDREEPLRATINKADGSYAIGADGLSEPVLQAQFAIEVNHRWVYSRDYPKHEVSQSDFATTWVQLKNGLPDVPACTMTRILR